MSDLAPSLCQPSPLFSPTVGNKTTLIQVDSLNKAVLHPCITFCIINLILQLSKKEQNKPPCPPSSATRKQTEFKQLTHMRLCFIQLRLHAVVSVAI